VIPHKEEDKDKMEIELEWKMESGTEMEVVEMEAGAPNTKTEEGAVKSSR